MIVITIIGVIVLLIGIFLTIRAIKIRSDAVNQTTKELSECRDAINELQKQQRLKVSEIEDLEDKIQSIKDKIILLQEKEKEVQK